MKNHLLLLLLFPLVALCDDVTLTLPLNASVATTVNPHFVSYTTDWWTGSDDWSDGTALVNMDFDNPKLQAAAAALSPAIWRIGGTRADKITYDFKDYGDDVSAYDENPHCKVGWCLTRARWLKALEFAQKVKARMVFTLNYVEYTESVPGDKHTVDGAEWDSTGARQLMELSREFAPPGLIYGFELGNEVQHGDLSMDFDRLGRAYKELRSIIDEVWPEAADRPKLLGPATSGSHYKQYLPHIGEFLDIVTYHKYQHTGQDPDLANLILQPDFLWKTEVYSKEVKPAADFGIKEIWIGEGAMASHSGRANVTDTFLSTLWFANALGSMAKAQPLPITTFCRQTLVGGNYGLLDQTALDPNPDFYMMRIWKQLVGQHTLDSIDSAIQDDELLRVHAFCGTTSGEVVLIFVSIDENERTVTIPLGSSRDVYMLQGEPDVAGKQALLNGALQFMTEDGSLPAIVPVTEAPEQSLVIPPLSATFVVLHETGIATCGVPPQESVLVPPDASSEQEQTEHLPPMAPAPPPLKEEEEEEAPLQGSASSSKSHSTVWIVLVVAAVVLAAIAWRKQERPYYAKRRHTGLTQIDLDDLDNSGEFSIDSLDASEDQGNDENEFV